MDFEETNVHKNEEFEKQANGKRFKVSAALIPNNNNPFKIQTRAQKKLNGMNSKFY